MHWGGWWMIIEHLYLKSFEPENLRLEWGHRIAAVADYGAQAMRSTNEPVLVLDGAGGDLKAIAIRRVPALPDPFLFRG